MSEKPTLDYFLFLRALACILVIRQHIGFPQLTYLEFLWIGHKNSGGLAVAAFLVLSGYLTTKVLITKYGLNFTGILNFYLGRLARIAPLYYLITFFTLFFIFPYPIQGLLTSPDYQKHILELLTFTYTGGLPYWNQVYWVISIEVFFYLFAPMVAFVISKIFKLSLKLSLCCGFLSFLWLIFTPTVSLPSSLINQAVNLAGVFIFGGGLYFFHPWFNSIKLEQANNLSKFFKLRYLSLFLFYLALVVPWPEIWSSLNFTDSRLVLGRYFEPITDFRFGTIATSLLVGVGILIVEITGGSSLELKQNTQQNILPSKILKNLIRVINQIGTVSFGIYLIHMLFVFRINDTFRVLFLSIFKSQTVATYLSFLMACLASILVSIFLFWQFEVPAKKWILGRYNQILAKNKSK